MFVLTISSIVALAAAQPGRVIGVSGAWAAIDRGATCEALTRSPRPGPKGGDPAVAGFTFSAGRGGWAQFHVTLSRPVRAGTSTMLTAGQQKFLLAARGTDAWARDSRQDRAIIDALRREGTLQLATRDSVGRRFTEVFLTSGAATAIDRAAAQCALRKTGKIR